jgi:hypothetical protein
MHQTYTNNPSQQPIQTTYHNNLSHQSYQPNQINHQDNFQICASTEYNKTIHNHHQDHYVLLIIQVCYIIHKPCVNNTTNKCLQPCTKSVPIMYQLLINMYQHYQLYTSCMCQLINYLSQPCT